MGKDKKVRYLKVIITIKFSSHRRLCSTGGLFFCAVFDPHIFASLDDGSLYADNDERSYDSGFESISGKCCAHDTFDRISSIFQSGTIVPVTIVVALWSAGKGVLSVTSGLNSICENMETRNYFYLRIRASFYTVIFLLAIVSSLVLSVFGNRISVMIYEHIPFLSKVVEFIIRIRTFVTFVVLTVFWDLVYRFLPNRRNMAKTTLRKQLPGAVFTACGWLLLSFFFSVYLDVFKGFTSMYGSLTTIILIMLWLYGCMYIILLGGEINALLEKFLQKRAGNLKKKKEKEV